MSLIVVIILLTGLWVAFVLPRMLSKMERPTKIIELEEVSLSTEQIVLQIDGPDFYEYLYKGEIITVEKGSAMYMQIRQSLNRRR